MILMVYVLMISKSQLHAIVEYIAMILIIVLILDLTSPNIPSLSLEHLQRINHQRIHTTNRIHLSCTSPHTYLITLSPPPLCQTNTNLCLQLTVYLPLHRPQTTPTKQYTPSSPTTSPHSTLLSMATTRRSTSSSSCLAVICG